MYMNNRTIILTAALAILVSLAACRSVDLSAPSASLYSPSGSETLESAAASAWSAYSSGNYRASLSAFSSIVNSGDEKFMASRSRELGVRVGLGYSLLKLSRHDEALFQFGYDSAALIESALGEGFIHLARRDHAAAYAAFSAFPRLRSEASPYRQSFPVTPVDANLEAHRVIFMSLFYGNLAGGTAEASLQYSFLAGRTAEVGIDAGSDKIFSSALENR